MRSYFLLSPGTGQKGLYSRLGQLIKLCALDVDLASQAIVAGDVCFASGQGMALLSDSERGQLASSVLEQAAHLVIIPPHPRASWPSLLLNVPPPEPCAASFSPVTIVDEELQQACSQAQLTILYSQGILASTGRTAAATSEGQPVIVRYQHRSTWGQLVYTTLMLGSTSSRSQRLHRILLAQGLLSWLAQISPTTATPTPRALSAAPDLSYELPVVLMAVRLAQQDGALAEHDLKPAVDRIRMKLFRHREDFRLDEAVTQMETKEILSPLDDGTWTVHTQRLTEAINHEHLASYLRRLR